MFFKTIKRRGEYIIELEKNNNLIKKNSEDIQKLLLEDFIETLNEIQDIEAIKMSETEKLIDRIKIITKKRTEYITKLIELSNTSNGR